MLSTAVAALIPAAACGSPPAPAASAVFYVSPRGNDANPGSQRRPWRTIGMAMRRMRAGQTTFVRPGVYAENAGLPCASGRNRLDWTRSGTRDAPITLAGLRTNGGRVVVRTHLSLSGDHLRLRGMTVGRNRAYSPFDRECTGSIGISVWGDDVALSRLVVRNAAMSGVYLEGADRARIVRSRIHTNGSHFNLDHGVYYKTGERGLIANNLIHGNHAHGIKLGPGPSEPLVAHNTIVGNGAGGKGSGVMIAGDDGRRTDGARVVNNIAVANQEYGVRAFWEGPVGRGNLVERTLLHANGSGGSWYPRGGVSETGSIDGPPAFAGLARADYRLTARSPAIGAGLAGIRVGSDFRGRQRDAEPDLGALERR